MLQGVIYTNQHGVSEGGRGRGDVGNKHHHASQQQAGLTAYLDTVLDIFGLEV